MVDDEIIADIAVVDGLLLSSNSNINNIDQFFEINSINNIIYNM